MGGSLLVPSSTKQHKMFSCFENAFCFIPFLPLSSFSYLTVQICLPHRPLQAL